MEGQAQQTRCPSCGRPFQDTQEPLGGDRLYRHRELKSPPLHTMMMADTWCRCQEENAHE